MASDTTRVYIDIIGDLPNAGLIRHLEKARALGDTLVVGLFDDKTATELSHLPVMPLDERVAVISALRCVDEVIPAVPGVPDLALLDAHKIDLICLSDDYNHVGRQDALADILESGAGAIMPYAEHITTTEIVSRITGEILADGRDEGESAVLHPAPDRATATEETLLAGQAAILETLGAMASAQFGRAWLMNQADYAAADWVSFVKAMAYNETDRQAPDQTDPRFFAALISLVTASSRPGDRIAVLGGPADEVVSALKADGYVAEAIRPDTLPFDLPPVDVFAVLDPAWSTALIMDAGILSGVVRTLKREILMAVDFAAQTLDNYVVSSASGRYTFSDAKIRDQLHNLQFFEVADILTVTDGQPVPDDTPGCGRTSRTANEPTEMHGDCFRYLDGAPATTTDIPVDPAPVRWYRGSLLPIGDDTGS